MPKFNAGGFRHQVDVYLPSTSLDARGRRTGSPTIVLSGLPCSMEQLQALELIRAQKVWAEATHRVRCFQDPSNPLTERHYLLFGLNTLQIGAVIDEDNTGVAVELLCKEERQLSGGSGTPIDGIYPALLYVDGTVIRRKKVNLEATAAPTATDDSSDGYEVGSWWYNRSESRMYRCTAATVGAAVWVAVSVGELATETVGDYVYLGQAVVGTAESDPDWTIARFSVAGEVVTEHASGAWTDRETLSYT